MTHETRSGGDKLDLHDLTIADAIERFVQEYNGRVRNNQFGCWTIIHGYGSTGTGGTIRAKLRAFLDQQSANLRYESGDQYDNPGWTWVYPKLRLPDRQQRLALAILSYCMTPRAEDKIVGEFIAAGGVKVKECLRALVKRGQLTESHKGSRMLYQTRE